MLSRLPRLGFNSPKEDAEEIKQKLEAFLHDSLKLELSQSKNPDYPRTDRNGKISRVRNSHYS